MRVLAALVLIVGQVASAAAQGMRDGDVTLDADEMRAWLAGKAALFFDGSEARYSVNGDYSYRYTPQDPALGGTYRATDDSRVCVTFSNGFGRCDTYVLSGDRLVLITDAGLRFPVMTLREMD